MQHAKATKEQRAREKGKQWTKRKSIGDSAKEQLLRSTCADLNALCVRCESCFCCSGFYSIIFALANLWIEVNARWVRRRIDSGTVFFLWIGVHAKYQNMRPTKSDSINFECHDRICKIARMPRITHTEINCMHWRRPFSLISRCVCRYRCHSLTCIVVEFETQSNNPFKRWLSTFDVPLNSDGNRNNLSKLLNIYYIYTTNNSMQFPMHSRCTRCV